MLEGSRALDPLRLHAPAFHAALAEAAARVAAAVPAALRQSIEDRVETALSGGGGDAGAGHLAFVDQFVVYSPGIGESHRRAAAASLPSGVDLETFTRAVWVADQTARQRLALGRLFEPYAERPPAPPPLPAAPSLAAAIRGMHAAAMLLDAVDPVTTELVRLRCADYHHCRYCRSVRLVAAGAAGADEEFLDQVRDYEASSLSEARKAALRLADAYMTDHRRLTPEAVDELRSWFEPAQIVEILLDTSSFNLQKVHVSLGTDAPAAEDRLTPLAFDAAGHSVVG